MKLQLDAVTRKWQEKARLFAEAELIPHGNRIGEEGDGMSFSHSWFRRERLMIAARDCGAAARLIEEATAYAKQRIVSGEPLIEKQLVQAMLADSVTELWAARLITFEAAEAHDHSFHLQFKYIRKGRRLLAARLIEL